MKKYVKLSGIEFKEIETITETKETVYSIKRLLEQKEHLTKQITCQKEELERAVKEVEIELAEIETLLLKAEELGVIAGPLTAYQ